MWNNNNVIIKITKEDKHTTYQHFTLTVIFLLLLLFSIHYPCFLLLLLLVCYSENKNILYLYYCIKQEITMSKEMKIKEPIRIRTKKLNNGNESIYLDNYVEGKREYEFLKLYLVPEKDRITKNRNTETMKLANAIKAQKIVEIQNNRHGFSNSKNKSNIKLINYIQYIADKDIEKTGRKVTSNTLIHHLQRYDKAGITFKQLDKDYIIGFVEYLKTTKRKKSM